MFNEEAEAAKYLGNDVIQNPKGTRELPARTCRHLAATNPLLPDGMYWIDPNGGRIQDAVEVHCRISAGETCIAPKRANVKLAAYFVGDRKQWFSQALASEFDYTIDRSQLSFLKALSGRAIQRISFKCDQAAIINDASTSSRQNAATLWSDNDVEITYNNAKHAYTVIKDNCEYKKKIYRSEDEKELSSQIEVNGRPQRLPIRDIALTKVGSEGQKVGLTIGDVCFS